MMDFFVNIGKRISRFRKVYKINKKSKLLQKKAERRDSWYISKLIDEVKKVDSDKIKEIEEFWKPYEFAYKNNPMTQLAFYNQSGVFEPSFVGFGQQMYSLVHFWNNETFSTFRNKNYSKLLFPFLKHPKSFIQCSYGNYFDDEYNLLSKEQAVEKIINLLKTEKELILKPALDSGSGSSIIFIDENTPEDDINGYISKLEPHFVCQEILKNHVSYQIGCSALNTVRVVTLIYNNEVKLVGAVFRMSTGKKVDNWDAGGIVCEIKPDGRLSNFAISGNGTRFECHPNGFEFNNHELYKAKDIMDTAIKCHKRISQQKYISWDFTVNENGEIVFIEMNSPGGSEVVQCLGINSYINKDIAKSIYDNYIYLHKANYQWNYMECAHHIVLREYCGFAKKVKIPQSINGKPVKSVAVNAFKNFKNLKKLFIPSNVDFDSKALKADNVEVVYAKGECND